MTKRRRIILILLGASLISFLAICAVMALLRIKLLSERGVPFGSGTVSRFSEIPRLGHGFDLFKIEGQVKYILMRRYRFYSIYFTGHMRAESVEAAFDKYDYMGRQKFTPSVPPPRLALVFRELDPGALESWTKDFWIITGVPDRTTGWFNMAYDPKTGKFWVRIDREFHEKSGAPPERRRKLSD